ncbi:MAG: hypothetical protein HPY44_05640 [Armatimonadetes bacterium]|nr:hypothetical protein [Armatimonadota bacterium]
MSRLVYAVRATGSVPAAAVIGLWLAAMIATAAPQVASPAWKATLDNSPGLHTTALEITPELPMPPPPSLVADLTCMDGGVWRARVPVDRLSEGALRLSPQDFTSLVPGRTGAALSFAEATALSLTADGSPASTPLPARVRWVGDNGVRYPWENDPAPIAVEARGRRWWPGLHRNNAGHFAWRYEPNGLLVDNVTFGNINRSWYWFKPGTQESFQFNFGVPDSGGQGLQEMATGDEGAAKTGLARRADYDAGGNPYQSDAVSADWTSLRWRRQLRASDGRDFFQELRYSTLACGIQVETDAPSFELSFQSGAAAKGPAAIIIAEGQRARVLEPASGLCPQALDENWAVLLANEGSPEIPIMVVFQRRPSGFAWNDGRLVVQRGAGVGTICIGSPFGVIPQPPDTLARWRENPSFVPVDHFRRFAAMLAGYPWRCEESFCVADGWVTIRDRFQFLPWQDDWGSQAQHLAPLPPLIAYSVDRGYLPPECVSGLQDMDWPTKWGPYRVAEGDSLEYRLPVPECRDFAPLAVEPGPEQWALEQIIANSLNATALQRLHTDEQGPGIYPHCSAHDMCAGAWRAANFLSPELRDRVRQDTRATIQSALFPQNYRLRQDPVTGTPYLACTFAWGHEDTPNQEGIADIDFWQGLVLYGLYTHAKYAGDWDGLKAHWPVIRSLASYWEALNSWALMGPGARESGEMYHGDMATAGFAGLIGFRGLARLLGTPYQRDLAEYLLVRNAVPMVAKFGFLDYARQMDQQEARGEAPCTGFGELWTASFPGIRPAVRDMGYGDIWWHTGCIGPQSAQPEVLDLLMDRCPQDMAAWEQEFRAACPDENLLSHDEIRVPPHILLRAFLGGELGANARDLARRWRKTYLPRDAHVAAMLLAWECPIRLADWAPAHVESARWDKSTRRAHIRLDAGSTGATVAWGQRGAATQTLLDGRSVKPRAGKRAGEWVLMQVSAPRGKHELVVQMASPAGTE